MVQISDFKLSTKLSVIYHDPMDIKCNNKFKFLLRILI